MNRTKYISSLTRREQLLVMLQNVNEVNREPAHIEWHLVHVTLTRQNCLVTLLNEFDLGLILQYLAYSNKNLKLELGNCFFCGFRWSIFLHITIYIEHIIQSFLISSMFGCSLLEMWALTSLALTSVKDVCFFSVLSFFLSVISVS